MRYLIVVIFFVFSFSMSCNNRLFTLKVDNDTTLKEILSQLSSECDLNIIIKDKKAKELINSKLSFINVKKQPLKELLRILFDSKDLFFSLNGNILTISFYKTETFSVNYIPSVIEGNSQLNSDDNKISIQNKFDFWSGLKDNLINILKNISSNYKDPIIDKNAGLVTITGTKYQLSASFLYV